MAADEMGNEHEYSQSLTLLDALGFHILRRIALQYVDGFHILCIVRKPLWLGVWFRNACRRQPRGGAVSRILSKRRAAASVASPSWAVCGE